MKVFENLPDHKTLENIYSQKELPTLVIEGLVRNPHPITPDEWSSLTRVDFIDNFTCLEGWKVQALQWSGFHLSKVIGLGKPFENAKFVMVHAQDKDFQVPFSLKEIESIFLCDRLNGNPLSLEHGAPWRLVFPGGQCFTSVKWVKSLELTAVSGPNLGQDIALGRI